jgi:hypothetical protein
VQIKQAREYFDLDLIQSIRIQTSPIDKGFTVLFVGKDKEWLLETALSKTKIFTSLDTAYKEIKSVIGRDFDMDVGVSAVDTFQLVKSN